MSDEPKTSAKKRKHKLEIQVYESDYDKVGVDGQPKWRPVNYGTDNGKPLIIEVADKKEFEEIKKRYELCDQRIRVVRELDPFVDESAAQTLNQNQAINSQNTPLNEKQQQPQMAISQHAPKVAPKIVKIGDIEIKYDGQNIYQKQWIRLTPDEASNFRVVNDSNNKIFSLNGKHIEARRWILTEDVSEQSDNEIEKIINSEHT